MTLRLPPIVIVRVKRVFARAIARANHARAHGNGWARMPGARQELIGTGYEIRHEVRHDHSRPLMVYAAYDPEGHLLAQTSINLPELKLFVEKQARARQEFDL